MVYRAHTEPELVQRWMLGPPGWSMPVCEMDVRPGGAFRHEYSDGAWRRLCDCRRIYHAGARCAHCPRGTDAAA
ncbi:SRPBCC domain-containing protein [Sulfitobacter porphyrae]|uniref:SRPBCC domain-containing protein n=1 Tax=Sulfitobacter porphyrae TaxID=1246864 RepID=A0ABW2B848_9RHOB